MRWPTPLACSWSSPESHRENIMTHESPSSPDGTRTSCGHSQISAGVKAAATGFSDVSQMPWYFQSDMSSTV
ncbi:hypothetical protein AHiyo4_39340 [Arthrobacter sp. Hiyo4]|nr:hypothetical protein AHiyo4_39340 [Arthrobacter sp. Hiyo4]